MNKILVLFNLKAGVDAQSDAMAAVVAAFGRYADNPQFVLVSDIE